MRNLHGRKPAKYGPFRFQQPLIERAGDLGPWLLGAPIHPPPLDIETAELNLETVSGDIKIEELVAEKIRAKTISGDIAVKDYTGNIDVGSTSGDISLVDGRDNEDVDASTVSGDILIEQDVVSDMKLKSTSGDVKINLSEDSQFYLDVSTVSGDIKHDFSIKIISSGRRDLEGTVGDAEERIMISTVSGDVTVGY